MATDDPVLTIRYRLRKSDLYRALFFRQFIRWQWYAGAIFVASMVWIATSDWGSSAGIPVVIAAVAYSWIPIFIVFRYASKHPDFGAPILRAFSDDGIATEAPSQSSKMKWSLIQKATEIDQYIPIYFVPGTFMLIPKSQLSSDETNLLRTILRGHLGRKARVAE
jgi:hypothetical protein